MGGGGGRGGGTGRDFLATAVVYSLHTLFSPLCFVTTEEEEDTASLSLVS